MIGYRLKFKSSKSFEICQTLYDLKFLWFLFWGYPVFYGEPRDQPMAFFNSGFSMRSSEHETILGVSKPISSVSSNNVFQFSAPLTHSPETTASTDYRKILFYRKTTFMQGKRSKNCNCISGSSFSLSWRFQSDQLLSSVQTHRWSLT